MLLSYYPAAPTEIAVLSWVAVCPYWQPGIPPASYPLSHQALRPSLFEAWMDSLGNILLETITTFMDLEGGMLQQALSQPSCFPAALLLDAAVQDKCDSTCPHPVPCINWRLQAAV